MKKILVLSRQYTDGSAYKVLKAYPAEKREEAETDKKLNEDADPCMDYVYRITEIPFAE